MKVAVVAVCHNEEKFLPYFFRHYRVFADYIVTLDNYSSDKSYEICQQNSDFTQRFDTNELHSISTLSKIRDSYWKKLRDYDWVFIVDVDEIVYHSEMRKFLDGERKKGHTVLVPTSFQMFCEEFPVTDEQITTGMPNGIRSTKEVTQRLLACDCFDKKCIINPKQILETNYLAGMHGARMVGNVKEFGDPCLKLLHYRFLGLEYLLGRNRMRASRLNEDLLKHGSQHYVKSADDVTKAFKEILPGVQNVVK